MKRDYILTVLVSVFVGVLGTLTFIRWNENKRVLKSEYRDWRKINLALRSIDENYVDTVDYHKVTDAALAAALSALDPHSSYLLPEVLKESEEDLAGNFEGIGIQFNVPNDTAIVLEVIPGGPSEKVGLKKGDRLLKVDDKVIAGVNFPQDSMVRRMKGPSGTKVTITVARGREVIPFEITRDKIPTHSVDAAFMVNLTTGYLRLSKFSRTTYIEFDGASRELLDAGMEYMILDLRGNSGGFLDQALMLANQFLDRGDVIVYMQGAHRKREEYKADGHGLLKKVKLSVLIDESSASSSEILAGAIQDNDRGTILGRRSFGKGLVQEPLYFSDGSGLRITVARFYTPSGRCIQKPYADDYEYDIYKRYSDGEMTDADSMKVDKSLEYHTVAGRTVYGGGGIVPDVFVPVDTTRVSKFFISCSNKATTMRFASSFFDSHRKELEAISDYDQLLRYLDSASLESRFLSFARNVDKLEPADEWKIEREYMMTQIRALVGRYSSLGDKAFFHLYLQTDDTFKKALEE
ncbi:MAG: S41 family peptidase [Bacteroidales bacterium]|nr:S41 family peptidase [Bacteroidales bacterium]